jgi:glycosyltransferase involved in cell wall biosynthesis
MLSVFVPAYNEERDIRDNIGEIVNALGSMDFEMFIVDDASTDATASICADIAKHDSRIHHVRYETGPSRRENLAQSFKLAKGQEICFLDADLSASPNYLPMMAELLKKADIVIGSRRQPGAKTKRSLRRLIISDAYTLFVRAYFNSVIKDFQCGLKMFKREVILQLVQEAGYDAGKMRNFAWDVEILVRAQRKGLRIVEMPVTWTESDRTTTQALRDIRMLPYLIGLRFRLGR